MGRGLLRQFSDGPACVTWPGRQRFDNLFRFGPVRFAARLLFLTGLFVLLNTGCSSKKNAPEGIDQVKNRIQAETALLRAELLLTRGDPAQAKKTLESIQGLTESLSQQQQASYHLLLGRINWSEGNTQAAADSLDKSLELDKNNDAAWVFLGVVQRSRNNFSKAREAYQKAIGIRPENAAAHNSLGALCIFEKKFDQAVDHLKLATELDSASAVAHSNLALALAHLGRFEDAEKNLQKAIRLGYPKSDVIQAQIDRMKIQALQKINQDARDAEKNPPGSAPSDPARQLQPGKKNRVESQSAPEKNDPRGSKEN